MTASDLRILVLGGGPVVRSFHLLALDALGCIDNALVVDRSEENLSELRALVPRLRTLRSDFRTVLSESKFLKEFDAVIIALPNSLHAQATEQALAVGLPVLCEKPLAINLADCERLAAPTHAAALLSVAMVMRCMPGIVALKRALDERMVGDIHSVDMEDGSAFAWDSESGEYFSRANGGVLLNIGVHYLDLLTWMLGELSPVSYEDDADGGVEANALFSLRAGITPVRMEVSYSRGLRNALTIRGARGQLTFDKMRPDGCDWSVDGLTGRLVPDRLFTMGDWEPTLPACFAEQLGLFVQAVKSGAGAPVPVQDAVMVAALIEWAGANRRQLSPRTHFVDVTASALAAVRGKVVITGATGFVGTRLAGALSRREERAETVALVRSFRSGAMIGRLDIQRVKADLLNVESIRVACRSAKHVFHLAYGGGDDSADRVTIEGAVNVCVAAAAEGVESVVVVGTTAVYGPSGSPVDEAAPLRTTGSAYELAKAEMVRRVMQLAKRGEMGRTRVTVLEPACVYGPGGRAFTELPIELARSGSLVWIDEGRGAANLVYVDNFVDALLRAATTADANGKRFIIQDCCVTWREFLRPLLGPYSDNLRSLRLEEFDAIGATNAIRLRDVTRAILRNDELASTLMNWRQVAWFVRALDQLSPALMARLRRVRHGKTLRSTIKVLHGGNVGRGGPPPKWLIGLYGPGNPVLLNDRAKRVLGWTPRVNLNSGLERSVEWLRYVKLRS